jgi:hypothetical protein
MSVKESHRQQVEPGPERFHVHEKDKTIRVGIPKPIGAHII